MTSIPFVLLVYFHDNSQTAKSFVKKSIHKLILCFCQGGSHGCQGKHISTMVTFQFLHIFFRAKRHRSRINLSNFYILYSDILTSTIPAFLILHTTYSVKPTKPSKKVQVFLPNLQLNENNILSLILLLFNAPITINYPAG